METTGAPKFLGNLNCPFAHALRLRRDSPPQTIRGGRAALGIDTPKAPATNDFRSSMTLAIPLRRLCFARQAAERCRGRVWSSLSGIFGREVVSGNGRISSRSWGTPLCSCPALRPRWDRRHLPLRCVGVAPVVSTTKAPAIRTFEAQWHGFGTGCLRFAVQVTRTPRKTRFRLLATLFRTGLVTRRVPLKGFKVYPTSNFLSQVNACKDTIPVLTKWASYPNLRVWQGWHDWWGLVCLTTLRRQSSAADVP